MRIYALLSLLLTACAASSTEELDCAADVCEYVEDELDCAALSDGRYFCADLCTEPDPHFREHHGADRFHECLLTSLDCVDAYNCYVIYAPWLIPIAAGGTRE